MTGERRCNCGHKQGYHRKDGTCRAGAKVHQYGIPCTEFILNEWWFRITSEAEEVLGS